MEIPNFSIIACTYNNPYYLKNFLWTVNMQDYTGPFETIIVDNASPNDLVLGACSQMTSQKIHLRYYRIEPKDKKCTNISQGINLAASKAKGKFFVIIADPNVLLSHNLLSSISKQIKYDTVILSAGRGNDVKISPDGLQKTEYKKLPTKLMEDECEALLKEMGWYCDPLELKLLPNKHRWPPPHDSFDCYIVALSKASFFKYGGYPTTEKTWGIYHHLYTEMLTKNLKQIKLTGIRIVHQYHPVFKEDKE